MSKKPFTISSLDVVLPNTLGVYLATVLVLLLDLAALHNTSGGSHSSSRSLGTFRLWVSWLYAGLSGNFAIRLVLKKKNSFVLLLRSYAMHVLSYVIGLAYIWRSTVLTFWQGLRLSNQKLCVTTGIKLVWTGRGRWNTYKTKTIKLRAEGSRRRMKSRDGRPNGGRLLQKRLFTFWCWMFSLLLSLCLKTLFRA